MTAYLPMLVAAPAADAATLEGVVLKLLIALFTAAVVEATLA